MNRLVGMASALMIDDLEVISELLVGPGRITLATGCISFLVLQMV